MNNPSRLVGIGLIIVGILSAVLIIGWLASGVAEDSLEMSGALLGGFVGLLAISAPLTVGGVLVLARSRKESERLVQGQRQRRILGRIEAGGQVSISDLAIETQSSRDQVRTDLVDLVSMGLFAGYVDWDDGILYSRDASALRERRTCENCGGELSLAGKGVIRCPFCGTEYFLP